MHGVCYQRNAWFPALRFRSSVQIGSSCIFSVPVQYIHATETATALYRTAVRTRITETVLETDSPRMKGNVTLETMSDRFRPNVDYIGGAYKLRPI